MKIMGREISNIATKIIGNNKYLIDVAIRKFH